MRFRLLLGVGRGRGKGKGQRGGDNLVFILVGKLSVVILWIYLDLSGIVFVK